MSKRILSLVLAFVMVLGTFGTVFANTAETALDSKVQWLIDQGLLQGDGTGEYGLDKAITRDVLARIVAVALEEEAAALSLQSSPSGFVDMTVNNWANGYASYANAKGYMIGNANREFMPTNTVSYAEALVVLTKIALNGDLTAAEKANSLTWYAPYVAKANELGVTEGVAITNISAPAVKEDILKMLYNVLNNKDFGNYNVLKVIVLENDRISRIGANEVTVEVIKEVQRANFVDANRADLRGEQYTYELPAKFNAEDLLGKVVDLSINKENKVVEVKVDTTYEVLTGAVSGITNSRLTINRKQYIVNLDERYNKEDERVYRTYLNDKALKYVDFAKDNTAVEYARVTVKAGKVLFVDAFKFDDIMPVKEVKEVRGKATILSYDDVRNNNLIEKTVSNARVILVNDKKFTRGTLEDVKANNVLHVYTVGSVDKYIVLQDSAILGKLDRITREDKNRTGYEYGVVVEGETYVLPILSPKQAVYEYESDGRFYTLEADRANMTLDNFRGKEVKVLLSLAGSVQYVGSEVGFSDYVGIATRIVGDQMRALNPENKENDYRANLDTKVVAGGTTGHKNLNNIDKNALVYINAEENSLKYVKDLTADKAINGLTLRELKVATDNYRITDDTVIYLINKNDVASVTTAKVVSDRYKKLNDTLASATATATDKAAATAELAAIRVSFINEADFEALSGRGNRYATPNHIHTMVIKGMNLTVAGKDAIYGKLVGHTDRYTDKTIFDVELANGTTRTFTTYTVTGIDADWERGAIYKIVESKTTDNLATSVEKVAFTANYAEIESIQGGKYVFVDGTHKYQTNSTQLFGSTPRVGHKIAYLQDSTFATDMVIIVNPGYVGDIITTTTGVVTYINLTAGQEAFAIDGDVYAITPDMVLKSKAGAVLETGTNIVATAATNELVKGDQVTINGKVITLEKAMSTRVTEFNTLVGKFPAAASLTVIGDVTAQVRTDVKAARDYYNSLATVQKGALTGADVTKLTDVETKITQLEAAAADATASAAVIAKITALPAAGSVALTNEAAIVEARAAYEALSAAAKGIVDGNATENTARLITLETELATLKADTLAVANAKAALTALPFAAANGMNSTGPVIEKPTVSGITFAFTPEAVAVTTPGILASGGAVVTANDATITRDSAAPFTFEIEVNITKGNASDKVVFVVTVQTGLSDVTMSVK